MRGEGDRAGPASAARRAPNASSPAEIGPSANFLRPASCSPRLAPRFPPRDGMQIERKRALFAFRPRK